MTHPERSDWLSISAYSRRYAVDRRTVYKWLEGGLLVVFRVGKTIRIKNTPQLPPRRSSPADYRR